MKDKEIYAIVRIYHAEKDERVLRKGVTKKHAKEHCRNSESAYTTCTRPQNLNRTNKRGPWFDVYRLME